MQLVDKSKLVFTEVRTVNNPEEIQQAVLLMDLSKVPVFTVYKTIDGQEIPIEPKPITTAHGKMSAEDAMVVASSIKGLTRTEQEAIEILCDYYRDQNDE